MISWNKLTNFEPVIRKAILQDVVRICEIVAQMTPGLPHDYRKADEQFLKIDGNEDCFLWVAELENKVVGTAMMHLQHKLSHNCSVAAHLEDLVIDSSYRGKGIGEKLLTTAVETARSRGAYKIMLTCYEKTTIFYQKYGFVKHDIGMRMSLKEEHPMVKD